MKKAVAVILSSIAWIAYAQDVRPIRDDVGFCWQRPQMERLTALLDAESGARPTVTDWVAAISPHDDYLYAGRVYYPLFKGLRTKEAVIFGVTHGAVRKEIGDPKGVLILDDYPSWAGLSGTVAISSLRERIKAALGQDDLVVSNQAHGLEHSIEALVPWLHYFNPDIRITPIMVTAMPFERMEELSTRLAAILAGYMKDNRLRPGRDIVFLISADANHYGQDFNNIPYGEDAKAHALGVAADRRIAGELVDGTLTDDKVRKLTQDLWGTTYLDYGGSYWCGKYDIPFGLLTIRKTMQKAVGRGLNGSMISYSDSYSEGVLPLREAGFGITAPFSLKHWVGYVAAAFYLD
jgi:AmmeMemoRadiSam system protein B